MSQGFPKESETIVTVVYIILPIMIKPYRENRVPRSHVKPSLFILNSAVIACFFPALRGRPLLRYSSGCSWHKKKMKNVVMAASTYVICTKQRQSFPC